MAKHAIEDPEFLKYLGSACVLADRYLELMEGICQREGKKLSKDFAEYKKLRTKFGEENNG